MASKQLQEAKNMRLQIDLKFNLVRWKKINQFVCLDLSSKQIDSSLPCFAIAF